MDAVFNQLGQTALPKIAKAVFPDLMNIRSETVTTSAGERIKSASAVDYEDVPVKYEPLKQQDHRPEVGGKLQSNQQYKLTFPTHHGGERVNIDPRIHTLVVAERGNAPEKTFRILSVADNQDVIFEVVGVKEN